MPIEQKNIPSQYRPSHPIDDVMFVGSGNQVIAGQITKQGHVMGYSNFGTSNLITMDVTWKY